MLRGLLAISAVGLLSGVLSQVTSNPTRLPTTSVPTLPTSAPTTSAPTTPAPTTPAPTTAVPTTAAPTTAAPTTVAPTTAAPTTAAPTTAAPTTGAPTTAAPTTATPTTPKPTPQPTTLAPTTSTPTTSTPTTSVPTPTSQAPTTAQPTSPIPTPAPTTKAPSPGPTPFPTAKCPPQFSAVRCGLISDEATCTQSYFEDGRGIFRSCVWLSGSPRPRCQEDLICAGTASPSVVPTRLPTPSPTSVPTTIAPTTAAPQPTRRPTPYPSPACPFFLYGDCASLLEPGECARHYIPTNQGFQACFWNYSSCVQTMSFCWPRSWMGPMCGARWVSTCADVKADCENYYFQGCSGGCDPLAALTPLYARGPAPEPGMFFPCETNPKLISDLTAPPCRQSRVACTPQSGSPTASGGALSALRSAVLAAGGAGRFDSPDTVPSSSSSSSSVSVPVVKTIDYALQPFDQASSSSSSSSSVSSASSGSSYSFSSKSAGVSDDNALQPKDEKWKTMEQESEPPQERAIPEDMETPARSTNDPDEIPQSLVEVTHKALSFFARQRAL